MSSLFITATDTGVGKTIVTAGIAAALVRSGRDVGVMKPLATGCRRRKGELVSEDAELLVRAARAEDTIELINPIAFHPPLSPYTAARIDGGRVNRSRIERAYKKLAERHDLLLVEGIGGLMTPIGRAATVADLAADLGLPLVIVARATLGTLNHTLLTLHYARCRGLDLRAVIVNHSAKPSGTAEEKTNVEDLRHLCGVPVAEIPYLGSNPERRLAHPAFARLARLLFLV